MIHNDYTNMTPRRVPFVDRLPIKPKNHLIAMISEFVGTFMFLLLAFGGTHVANTLLDQEETGVLIANSLRVFLISCAFGVSLAVNAWVFFRITGGLFNPAVTLGLVLVGALDPFRGVLVAISQILGGIASAAILLPLFPGPLKIGTTLGGGASIAQGFFIEMFLTAQLVLTIFFLAAEKHRATYIAPVGIGLAMFISELMGVYYTGGSLNPARSFGPSVATRTFPGYHWIYWIGPMTGTLLAAGFYALLKALNYETVNPDADMPRQMEEGHDPIPLPSRDSR